MASPIDPEASGVIGWALSGVGTAIMGVIGFVYSRLRRLNKIETEQLVENGLQEFEETRIMPILNRLESRVANVEKLDHRLGAMQVNMERLHETVEKNALEASRQLTGAMNRLGDQRKEDKEIQLERLDNLKDLIEAKIK